MKKEIKVIFNAEDFPRAYSNTKGENLAYLLFQERFCNEYLEWSGVLSLKQVLNELGYSKNIDILVNDENLFWTREDGSINFNIATDAKNLECGVDYELTFTGFHC